jgi:hypothetical protein
LPPSMLDDRGLLRDSCPYIGVLVRSGYEFLVAFFAIRVMGSACMPIGKGFLSFFPALPLKGAHDMAGPLTATFDSFWHPTRGSILPRLSV